MENPESPDHEDDLKRVGEAYILPGRIEAVEREQAEAKKRDGHYKEQQLGFDRKLVRYTFLLFVVGMIGTVITVWQSLIAQSAANTARRAAEIAASGLTETRNANAVAARAASAAETSNEISERIVAETLESTHREQRAWLSFTWRMDKEPTAQDETFTVKLPLQNTGKTPAFRVRFRALPFFSANTSEQLKEDDWRRAPWNDVDVVFPGEQERSLGIDSNLETRKLPPSISLAPYRARNLKLWVLVELRYCDAFGRLHWINACGNREFNSGSFRMCGIAADNNMVTVGAQPDSECQQ